MATELVTFKIEHEFLEEVDRTAKKSRYQNRTEFIRAALREKVDEAKLKEAMIEVGKMKGKASRKTTDEEREQIREKAFEELDRRLR